jgi:hypothetical protein
LAEIPELGLFHYGAEEHTKKNPKIVVVQKEKKNEYAENGTKRTLKYSKMFIL